jgi:calcineurin-like phosphoesterase family protein
MTHCPLRGIFREAPINQDGEVMKNFTAGDNWHGESRHNQYSFPDFGQFHLHGHTHKRKGNDVVADRQWDIGVVGNSYRPVSHSQIESWIANYKSDWQRVACENITKVLESANEVSKKSI